MSEPRLISPLLDNFTMGGPFSDRFGVRCCPAMENGTDKRYIVKVISVPASPVQIEALLLTGACSSTEDALRYFHSVAEDTVQEAELLKTLSSLEGFLPFEASQIVPMEDGTGFEVYLLSPYRKSLERQFRKYPMTHLAAVNLGLDLCASLAVCRQSGYLYTNLKPDNVFISEDQEYRIGDLGFTKLSSLAYATLPDKSRSAYTPPEVTDAMSSLNTSLDVYAVGMILYQAYNGGTLPFQGQASAKIPLEPPLYADYEMAEIILKAICPEPDGRWEDPVAMGQALVAYMQRNEVNNTYIVPPVVLSEEDMAPRQEAASEAAETGTPDADQVVIAECFDNTALPEIPEEAMDLTELLESEAEEDAEAELLNLSFLDDFDFEDIPADEEGLGYEALSPELGGMLEQADDLISHETPEGVVQPEAIEVPVPVLELPQEEACPDTPSTDATLVVPVAVEAPPQIEEELVEDYGPVDKKIGKKILTVLLLLLLLAGIFLCSFTIYKEYYLQPVTDLRLIGSEDDLQVFVVSDVDESRLSVVCTDIHGTAQTAPVKNGVAVFDGLNPNTLYTVKVEVSGFGKLIGDLTDNYTTPVQTTVSAFQAVTGSEAGTVILTFAIEGQDSDSWNITYQTDGEPQVKETFTGHVATISGLTLGKTYTFTLDSDSDLYLVGTSELEYTAVAPVTAQDLAITGCAEGSLRASWSVPEGTTVSQWTVRCYSDKGYDQTIVTDKTEITFTGIAGNDAHTVEVTAAGMSEAARSYMTANSITVTEITAAQKDDTALELKWDTAGVKPSSSWLVMYSIDGSAQQEILRSDSNTVTVSPIVPGALYSFTIQQENSNTVFGGSTTCQTEEAKAFSAYSLKASQIEVNMCKAPAASEWTREDLADGDYRIQFAPGELAGFVLKTTRKFDSSKAKITVTYVIRNADGVPVSWDANQNIWKEMWNEKHCYLTVPAMPAQPGSYTIEIYFNGQSVCDSSFTITE